VLVNLGPAWVREEGQAVASQQSVRTRAQKHITQYIREESMPWIMWIMKDGLRREMGENDPLCKLSGRKISEAAKPVAG
jgi:hypothetical protein